jgi:hypothetical protein
MAPLEPPEALRGLLRLLPLSRGLLLPQPHLLQDVLRGGLLAPGHPAGRLGRSRLLDPHPDVLVQVVGELRGDVGEVLVLLARALPDGLVGEPDLPLAGGPADAEGHVVAAHVP